MVGDVSPLAYCDDSVHVLHILSPSAAYILHVYKFRAMSKI